MKTCIFIVLLLFESCAGFRTHENENPKPWPVTKKDIEIPIEYSIYFKQVLNGETKDTTNKIPSVITQVVADRIQDSNVFILGKKAKYNLEFYFKNDGEYSQILSFLTGFTFGLIPGWAVDKYNLILVVKNPKGEVLGKFEANAQVNTWIQIALIVMAPFMWPFSEIKEAISDVTKATIIAAIKQKIIR